MKKPLRLLLLLLSAWLPGQLQAQTATHTWDFNGQVVNNWIEGWTITNYNPAVAEDGILKLHGTKTNNLIRYDVPVGSIDPAVSKIAVIRLKNGTAHTQARFYFWTVDPTVNAAYIDFNISAYDSDFQEYYIDLSKDPRWTGTIKIIRFDIPLSLSQAEFGKPILVDQVRLLTEGQIPENPNAQYTHVWEFNEPVSGNTVNRWSIVNYTNASTSNGILSLTGSAANNNIRHDVFANETLDANTSITAVIKLKNETPATKARFYFWTIDPASTPSYVEFDISANDTEFKEYRINLTANPDWMGLIRIIRFDIPATLAEADFGKGIKIDYIKLSNKEANALSSNAALSGLSLSAGTLTPAFATITTAYTAQVPQTTESIDITPTVADSKASVKVNGTTVASGTAATVNLNEGSNTIAVLVTAEDGTTQTYTVTVTRAAANQTPTNLALSATSVAEGVAVGTTVGTFTTTDADATDTHTYSLIDGEGDTDNAAFTIENNALKTAANVDFEAKESYSVRVQTTDAQGAVFSKAVAITVTNVNEAPTALALSASTVAENQATQTVVGTLSATDPDAGDTFTYALVSGEGDTDNASFTIDGNALKTVGSLDFESKASYSVRIQALDAAGLSFGETFEITVSDVNEAPTALALSSNELAENNSVGAVVGSLSAVDADAASTFTYTLVSGEGDTDNSMFSIDGNELKAGTAFDFETKNSYTVRLQVTDNGNLTFSRAFNLSVTNVNEAPTAVALSKSDINENNAAGETVGTFSTTDVDAGETFTYSLVAGDGDTDNASFTIEGNALKAASAFDFEAKNSYSVRVQTTDAAGLTFSREFTVTVNNQNEAPTALALSNATLEEGNVVGHVIGTFTTTDPDAADTHSYTLVSGDGDTDNAAFTIENNSLKAAEAFDFETKNSYSVRVQATDASGLSVTQTFSISVTDVAETGIKEDVAASGKYNVYPNPTQALLTLSTDVFNGGNVQVLDLSGRVVLRSNVAQQQVNVANLPAGSYILVVVKGNERLYKRFLKL